MILKISFQNKCYWNFLRSKSQVLMKFLQTVQTLTLGSILRIQPTVGYGSKASPKYGTGGCSRCFSFTKAKPLANRNRLCLEVTLAEASQHVTKFATWSALSQNFKGVVYHSSSRDIFYNLAFEDWVYKNLNLDSCDVLMLWCNDPCVVVGRHQNPWAECNHKHLKESRVALARRRSGGGTVYHDGGNLNCTFFTSRERYNRKNNLNTIISAVTNKWPDVDVSATSRDDIILNKNYKISGTASKLGRKIAYHHCTLLHSCDKSQLIDLLDVNLDGITNKATRSVPSVVKNLQDVNININHGTLVNVIAEQFYKEHLALGEAKIYDIDPSDEKTWPGIHGLKEELESWSWVYGKTPPFSIQRGDDTLSVLLHINRGIIDGVIVRILSDDILIDSLQQLSASLKGVPFTRDDLKSACNVFLHAAVLEDKKKLKLAQVCSLIQEALS
ncbi:Lipoyltransferase 1, mitochondrial [Holothuria leucospilota]|uniref:Lipoyltransferase 1, mitochondrial n=1 Tax=Holothuria leucospilota TaxID=206669 RepID=A0A9Q1BFC4_HOLLE|nr:Lipoyltransferase 1, mitochondrial [Holothuria leucospilota]